MNKNTVTNTNERTTISRSLFSGHERAFEEWSSAGIGNAFLFGKVMTANPDLLLELLQYALPEFHIQKIHNVQKEVDIKLSIDSHGVRLDILTSDDRGRQIDVEMQMQDEKNIPHRMRYYSGSIDQTILEKGRDYNELGDMVILFITPFDPFYERGYYKYTFRSICLEDRELELQDGITKVILNAKGGVGNIPTELKEFLQLVAGSSDPDSYAEGSFADRVQKQVHIARHNARWRKEYMDWEMTLRHERAKGREEGREEGLKEGREEERAKTEEQRKRAEAAEEKIRQLEEQLALLQSSQL